MTRDIVDALHKALSESGVRGVLRFLNGRTEHRFTGLYRFDPPVLRSVYIYDSTNPELEVGADAPLRETYCSIVGAEEESFGTEDAREDPRLAEHPARDTTLSYTGALLRTPDGEPFGTLCHFDLVPRPVASSEIPVLELAAELLAHRLEEAG